mmetsp:Transcript_13332/g.38909  ORF Transcript_13332/g.38909 Transcript_13332/m.38909 type:complete len:323 (+) Transcript_13332:50-1018(+)
MGPVTDSSPPRSMSRSWQLFRSGGAALSRCIICETSSLMPPETLPMYADGGSLSAAPATESSRSGKDERSSQFCVKGQPLIALSMALYTELGTISSCAPVSRMAPQPPAQPSLTRSAGVSAWASTWKTRSLTAISQVRLLTMGAFTTPCDPSRVASFQTIQADEPGSRPTQKEKEVTPKLSSVLGMALASFTALANSSSLTMRFGGTSRLCAMYRSMSLRTCASPASAAIRGCSGGPTPTMAFQLTLARTGMWQSCATQTCWPGTPWPRIDTFSWAALHSHTPMPKEWFSSRGPGLKVGLEVSSYWPTPKQVLHHLLKTRTS